jgi:hypothetical protein
MFAVTAQYDHSPLRDIEFALVTELLNNTRLS